VGIKTIKSVWQMQNNAYKEASDVGIKNKILKEKTYGKI
jgi:hypothetical protein